MAILWALMLISSMTLMLIHNPSGIIGAMITGSHNAVKLAMELAALYALWLGFFALIEKTGVNKLIEKLLRPLTKLLFPGANDEARRYITMNISANLLGLGNAATPMAIRAIGAMDGGVGKASPDMIMLVVLSCCSLQLLPTTVIGLRATHGSANPSDFLLPCAIATVISTLTGISLVKLCAAIFDRKRRPHKKAAAAALPLAAGRGEAR